MASLSRLAAELSVVDGDLPRAIEYWRCLQGLTRWSFTELTVVHHLVGLSIQSMLCGSLRECLEIAAFSDEQLQLLQETLGIPFSLEDRHYRSLDAEMIYLGCNLLDAMLSGGGRSFYPEGPAARGVMRLWLKAEKLCYLRFFRHHFTEIARVYGGAKFEFTDPSLPWYAYISPVVCPVITTIAHRFFSVQAQRRLTRCAIQLRRHKLVHGVYPPKLDVLIFDAIHAAKATVDPFTGTDLIYRPAGDGFVLYSVGKNLEDDGGQKADVVVSLQN
jgi:hypothetical protein